MRVWTNVTTRLYFWSLNRSIHVDYAAFPQVRQLASCSQEVLQQKKLLSQLVLLCQQGKIGQHEQQLKLNKTPETNSNAFDARCRGASQFTKKKT